MSVAANRFVHDSLVAERPRRMTPPPPLHILILAAGAARRMRGADKLLEPVEGQPLLRRLARHALATGLPVTVTLPPDRPARQDALAGLALDRVVVADAATGMASSLRAGLARIAPDRAVLLLLADLPEITAEDLALMARHQTAAPDLILRATDQSGLPGHPVVFPPWARQELAQITGDEGARQILRRHADRVQPVALPEAHATTDLDTPEDWAAWRLGRQ